MSGGLAGPQAAGPDAPDGGGAAALMGGLAGAALPLVLLGNTALAVALGLAELGAVAWLWRSRGTSGLAPAWSPVLVGLALATFGWWLGAAALAEETYKAVVAVLRTGVFLLGWLALVLAVARFARAWTALLRAGMLGGVLALGYAVFTMYVWPPALVVVDVLHTDDADRYLYFKSFASVAALLVPALLFSGLCLGGAWRWTAVAAAPLAGLVIFGGGGEQFSRSAMAGLIGAAAAPAILLGLTRLSRAWRRGVVTAATLAVLAGAAAYLDDLPRPPWTADKEETLAVLPDAHRQVIWGFVWERALASPVVGVGPNTVNMVPGAAEPIPNLGIDFEGQEYVPAHPHNWVVEIAAETGFPGLMLFLAALAAVGWALLRAAVVRPKTAPAAMFAAAILGGYLASSLANFSFWAAWWQNAFLLALLPPAIHVMRPAVHAVTPLRFGRAERLAVLLAAAGVALALGAATTLHGFPGG